MKLPFVHSLQPADRTFRIGSLILELALSGAISIGCAIGALSIGRDQFAENWIPWTTPVFVMAMISLLYVGILAHLYRKTAMAHKKEMKHLSRIRKHRSAQH